MDEIEKLGNLLNSWQENKPEFESFFEYLRYCDDMSKKLGYFTFLPELKASCNDLLSRIEFCERNLK